MNPVIPVLDLMIGQIVLAQGGNRDAYRPVHSRLTHSSRPLDVAQAIFNQTGCDWLYLADLDSFAGAAPNWTVYRELLERGFGIWVDADWITNQRYLDVSEELTNHDRLRIIVSSETIQNIDQFSVFESLFESGITPVFSLDKKGDAIVAQSNSMDEYSSLELVQRAYDKGVRELIVLDLDEVGTKNGFSKTSSAATLIDEIKIELTELRLTSGGGVRVADDIKQWLDAGCDHVLVASAIHECLLTPDDVSGF